MLPLDFSSRRNSYFFMKKNILISLLGCCLVAKLYLTLMTPWTVAHWASLSMRFPRQEYWSGCHFLLQEIFLTQGLNPHLLLCRQTSLPCIGYLVPNAICWLHTRAFFLLPKVPVPSQQQQKVFCLALLFFSSKNYFGRCQKRTKSAHGKNHLTDSTNPGNSSVFYSNCFWNLLRNLQVVSYLFWNLNMTVLHVHLCRVKLGFLFFF